MSSRNSIKRNASNMDNVEPLKTKQAKSTVSYVSSVSSVPDSKSFDDLIYVEKPDHEQYRVNLSTGQRCDASKLSADSKLYRPARITVLRAGSSVSGNSFSVRNQDLHKKNAPGADWALDASLISNQCWSPDQYTDIKKVTMTELASKLKEEVGDCICKVEFFKLPEASEKAKFIREGSRLIESSDLTEAKKTQMFKKLYESSQVGEYRIMRGYICRSEDQEAQETETGMLKFIDADILAEGQFPMRQINLRNIQALTFKLTRYELK